MQTDVADERKGESAVPGRHVGAGRPFVIIVVEKNGGAAKINQSIKADGQWLSDDL